MLAHDANRFRAAVGFAEAMTGHKNTAKEIQKELLLRMKNEYVPAYDLAVLSIGLGEIEQALEYLEQAYTNREPWMPFIGMNPLFTTLYGNSQFQDIVRRIKRSSK